MRNRILLILLGIMLVALPLFSACAAPTQTTPAPTTQTPTPTTPAPAKVYEWKLQSYCSPAMEKYTVLVSHYVEMVEEYTQGRIKFTSYPVGAIVPASEMLKACGDNVLQMVHATASYVVGLVPVAGLECAMPRLWETYEDLWTIMCYRGFQDLLTEVYAQHGTHLLGFEMSPGIILLSKKPIRTINDLRGVKIRAFGTNATFIEKLGASPVNIPMVEIYMAAKLGTIDAAIGGWDMHYAQKHHEVLKYLMLPWITEPDSLQIQVNLDEWNALPDDLQNILTLVTHDWSHWALATEKPGVKKVMDGYRAAGVEFIQLSPDDVAKMDAVAVELWDEWAKKDDYCARAVGIIKDYYRETGRIK